MRISNNSNYVIDGTTSHSTKPASGQVVGYPAQAGIQRFYLTCIWVLPTALRWSLFIELDSGLRRNDDFFEVQL